MNDDSIMYIQKEQLVKGIAEDIREQSGQLLARNKNLEFSVAELIVGMAIASYRDFPKFFENQKNHLWRHDQSKTINGKIVALIGNGNINKKVKKILNLFPDTQVYSFSKTGSNGAIPIEKLDNVIHKFDIIVVAVPLNDSTTGLISKERLDMMKPGALLINISKGMVIDQEALVESLNNKKIFAAIDQAYPDPLPSDHPLWDCPNIIIMPHVGSNAV